LALADAQAEVRRQHVHQRPPDLDGGRKRAARLAPFHRQVDAVNLDNPVPGEQRVAEAQVGHGLSCRFQRTLIAVEQRQDHGLARFQRNAGGVGELLQRHNVCVELADDHRDAIRIVPAIGSHAPVHVVGRDPQGA
jgi:hypothetical protein